MSPLKPAHTVSILGTRLDCVDWKFIDQFVADTLTGNEKRHIVTLNGEIALLAETNTELREAINAADLVTPDSTNVVWAARRRGGTITERTPGSELVERVAKECAKREQSLYLLGGKPGIAAKAAATLQQLFPKLGIAGSSSKNPDDTSAISDIAASAADVVLVAYGAPNQEIWIYRHKSDLPATLLIGIGGTFDMLAGTLPRAPKLLRNLHLEWLWRFILQPKRVGRIWRALVVFPVRILFHHE